MGQTYTLERTGQRALSFTGTVVASASTRVEGWRGRQRWHEVTVYRTEGGAWVLQVAFRSEWPRELARDAASAHDTPEAVEAALLQADAGADVTGFPEGAQFERKKARDVERTRAAWQRAVSAVLDRIEAPERVP